MRIPVPEELAAQPGVQVETNANASLRRIRFERDGQSMELLIERRSATFTESASGQDWAEWKLQRISDAALHRRRCAFCEKTDAEVLKLIAGPTSYICNECIEVCARILSEA